MTDIRVAVQRKKQTLIRRKKRVRKKVFGSAERPRLNVFLSNRHIYAQLINDVEQNTIVGCSTMTPLLKEKCSSAVNKIEQAKRVGEHIAAMAKDKGIAQVQFDRNGRRYHGRVKALAEGARAGGLQF